MLASHPYADGSNTPRTKLSVVAFVDVLGFVQRTSEAYASGTAPQLLVDIRTALQRAFCHVEPHTDVGRPLWSIAAFTDNIVLGRPISDDGEGELGVTMMKLSRFQLEMVRAGFFVRGGVTVGQLYMDGQFVFGDGLIEAHRLESTVARDPRIVLSTSARDYLNQHMSYYGGPAGSPQYDEVLLDADRQWFLNYLEALNRTEEELPPDIDGIRQHKERIEAALSTYASTPPIWSKYAWVAGYHDWFCAEYPRAFGPGYTVDGTARVDC